MDYTLGASSLWPFGRKKSAGPIGRRGTDLRLKPRYNVHELHCPLGEVVDLSESGARIVCKGRPRVAIGQTILLWLQAGNQKIQVAAQVRRIQRRSWRTCEVGAHFVGLSPSMAGAIVVMARFGFVPTGATKPAPDMAQQRPAIHADYALPDHYATLGIAATANDHQVHAAYRLLARKLHPDVNPGPDAQERFLLIKQAYDVLRDPRKRAVYDELRAQMSTPAFSPRK